jgi:carbon storage regulator
MGITAAGAARGGLWRFTLILSRQVDDSIMIGEPPDQWIVTVVALSVDKVRLGIKGPDGSSSVRLENTIVLSPDIAVTIVDIRGDKVRIGVEVPNTCIVYRHEIYEAIRRLRGDDAGGRWGRL